LKRLKHSEGEKVLREILKSKSWVRTDQLKLLGYRIQEATWWLKVQAGMAFSIVDWPELPRPLIKLMMIIQISLIIVIGIMPL
jgi:hypothetical protein